MEKKTFKEFLGILRELTDLNIEYLSGNDLVLRRRVNFSKYANEMERVQELISSFEFD